MRVFFVSPRFEPAFDQTRSAAEEATDFKRPDLSTLRPDFNLKVSKPVAIPSRRGTLRLPG